ncbi:MAG TPA: ABC transporter substrate-binding protein [Candidatus Binatia bacterium]|jgi:NitT/TauT family transport system substrate-binding protein|nr:ABC transporter substrate-binding protein [Candidatus Binatia bacterium]
MFVASLFIPRWRKKRILLGSILLLTFPLVVAAAEIGGKPEKVDVTVAYVSPSAAFTPLFVASEAGLFSKYGLKAKVQIFGITVALKGLLSEEVDFDVNGSIISARLGGAPVKYFGAHLQHYVFQMWGAKGITRIEQLKGKTVAVSTPRGAIDIPTREVLKKFGLIPDLDVKFLYNDQVPPILTAILTGTAAAGTISAPLTLKAREAGLNLLVDIGQLRIPGMLNGYKAAEKYLNNNPNTVLAFLKAMAEGVVLAKKDKALATKAIGKFVKIDDQTTLDDAYDAYAPHWETSFAVRDQVIWAELSYLNEKEFPQAKNANSREFFDNSFVEKLEKAGFFRAIGIDR